MYWTFKQAWGGVTRWPEAHDWTPEPRFPQLKNEQIVPAARRLRFPGHPKCHVQCPAHSRFWVNAGWLGGGTYSRCELSIRRWESHRQLEVAHSTRKAGDANQWEPCFFNWLFHPIQRHVNGCWVLFFECFQIARHNTKNFVFTTSLNSCNAPLNKARITHILQVGKWRLGTIQ